jgi:hypothetical protein
MDNDEWTVVKGGRKGGKPSLSKRQPAAKQDEGSFRHARDEAADKERATRLHETVMGLRSQISTCLVGQSLSSALSHVLSPGGWCLRVNELVVYGLGSVEDSLASRWQLCLALALRDLLIPPGDDHLRTLAYDPAFSPCDLILMQSLGIEVIEENEECKRLARAPTLFYMPHCEHHLYESLVVYNLSQGLLSNVAILGNSFSRYGESLNGSKPRRIMDLVAQGCVNELDVPCDPPKRTRDIEPHYPEGAFNNMSLHYFKTGALAI